MSLSTRLQSALAGRYVINRPLGEGGMGVVFHATDVKHDRPVAIKVLRSEAAESLGADRFLREIRITAKLDHPHILMLIDSGEADGLLYYVMPFVDGESLRDRLTRERPLAVSDALRIAVQVADALAHAHKRGVVHRDVKPENILLADGHVKLADFGIARAESTGQTTAALTQLGMALGTPAYMSPEQFFGDAHVDHRSDLYALACVVYEMLTGAPPFAGEAITKRLTADAPRLTSSGQRIPPMVDLVVARALAREAADRHATVEEFAGALQTEISGPVAVHTGVATEGPSPRAVFVGRERELADGRELLAGLAHGRGGLLLLGGEPGVGKTRLASALLDEARRLQALCLIGHCYEMEGMPPYTPFAEVLEYVSRLVPPATFRETLGESAAEVARVQPLLRQQFADIPEPLDLAPDKQRAHLHAQYRAFNERAAAVAPIVLLLDDLHWADEPSLALLANIATYLDRLPIIVIGTYRDTDLDTERPFASVLETLTRQRVVRKVAVRRLPIDGTAALLAALGGGAPPDALVKALHDETDGNPFFVEEVFQHLREEGRLFDAHGQWLTQLDTDTLDVPEGVRLVVGRRLKRLSEACQGMLLAAAVVGPRFELATLTALVGQDEDTLLDALDEAVAAHLISEERGARIASYRFAHELIRQTLLAPLSLPRRQRWHLKVAQALETHLGAKAAMRAADIAHHYFQAGAAADPDITVRWLIQAAEAALTSGAFSEALAQCDRANVVSDDIPPMLAAPLEFARGRAAASLGRWSDAMAALRSAERQCVATSAHDLHVDVLTELSVLLIWSGAPAEAIGLLEAALAAMPAAPSLTRVRVLAMLIRAVSQSTGDYPRTRALLEQAREEADASGDARAVTVVTLVYPFFCQAFGLARELERSAAACVSRLQDPQSRRALAEMLGIRVWAMRFTGAIDEARALMPELVELAQQTGHLGALLYADIMAGSICFVDGDLAGYVDWLRETSETWKPAGPWGQCNLGNVAQLMAERGDVAGGLALAREAATPEVGYWRGAIELCELYAASMAGPETFRDVLDRHAYFLVLDDQDASAGRILFTTAATECFARTGALAEAHARLPIARRVLENGVQFPFQHTLTSVYAGIAAAAGREWAEAEQHLRDARVLANRFRQPYLHAQIDLWTAWMLLQRRAANDLERARPLLDEAESAYASLGLREQVTFVHTLRSQAQA